MYNVYLKDLNCDIFTLKKYVIDKNKKLEKIENITFLESKKIMYAYDPDMKLYLCGKFSCNTIKFYLSQNILDIAYFDCDLDYSIIESELLKIENINLLDIDIDSLNLDYYDVDFKNDKKETYYLVNNKILTVSRLEKEVNEGNLCLNILSKKEYDKYSELNNMSECIFSFHKNVSSDNYFINISNYNYKDDLIPTLFSENEFLNSNDIFIKQGYNIAVKIQPKFLSSSEKNARIYCDFFGVKKYAKYENGFLIFNSYDKVNSDLYLFDKLDVKLIIDYLNLRINDNNLAQSFKGEIYFEGIYSSSFKKVKHVSNIYIEQKKLIDEQKKLIKNLQDEIKELNINLINKSKTNKLLTEKISSYILKNHLLNDTTVTNIKNINNEYKNREISNEYRSCYKDCWNDYDNIESNECYFEKFRKRYEATDARHLSEIVKHIKLNPKKEYNLAFFGCGHLGEINTFIDLINKESINYNEINIVVVDVFLWPKNYIDILLNKTNDKQINIYFSNNEMFKELKEKEFIYKYIDYFYFSRCLNHVDIKNFSDIIPSIIEIIKKYNGSFLFSQVVNESAQNKEGHNNAVEFLGELSKNFVIQTKECEWLNCKNVLGLITPLFIKFSK